MSSVHRSPSTLYGASFTTARLPSGDNATAESVPGVPNVPSALPCRLNQVSCRVAGPNDVRYARTPLADTENTPVEYHVSWTLWATGTGTPWGASRRASNGCAMSVPARGNTT